MCLHENISIKRFRVKTAINVKHKKAATALRICITYTKNAECVRKKREERKAFKVPKIINPIHLHKQSLTCRALDPHRIKSTDL